MNDNPKVGTALTPEQEAIRAKCFHPTGTFVPFEKEEVEQSIPARFEKIVKEYPDRIAVKTTCHTLTYAELNATANCVAGAILARNSERAEPIALLLDHGIWAIASILGILKAGKIFVPLDPGFSHDRISFILEHSRAGMLLTNREYISTAKTLGLPVLNVDELDPAISASSIGLSLSGNDLASLIHTSGSTGGSKGVFQNHRNILHKVANYTNSSHISGEDHLSLVVSLTFSAVVPNIFGALLNGASLFPFDIKKEGLIGLARWLRDQEITIYQSVTSVFRYLAGAVTGREAFPSLRLIDLFGEPVSLRDVELYKTIFSSHCLLRNRMATTETGDVLQYFMDKCTQVKESIVPVGFPVGDMEVLLLDDSGREANANQPGEITVKSRYLALGYWDQPNLTRTVFLSDPRGGDERIYLTGDLGLKLSDGCILHLGRKDSQVKIRGNRVATNEIESTLLTAETVKEAVVVTGEDVDGERSLIAYVVPVRKSHSSVSGLRDHLRQKLPDYMIPTTFVFLESLPLLPNGKVNRHALPSPDRITPESNLPYAPPETRLEKTLAEFWSELLGAKRVGIHDNFFDLGGDSLLAVQLFDKIEKAFKKRIPLSSLFEDATIDHLANLINCGDSKTLSCPLVAIRSEGSKKPFFCVHELFGDVLCYMSLARYLDQDQPFYALQAKGVNDGEEPLDDIEAMAARYVEQIRTVQPEGPYALGGLCFGGVVAFEMAQQLVSKGESVAMVALFDSVIVPEYNNFRWWSFVLDVLSNLPSLLTASWRHNCKHWFDLVAQLTPAECLALLNRKLRIAKVSLATRFSYATKTSDEENTPKFIEELAVLFDFSEQHLKIARAQYRALQNYKPQAYPGRVTLFRPSIQPLSSSRDPKKGWGPFAIGGLDVRVVPGNHLAMLQEPHVRILAEELRDCLHKAQLEVGSRPESEKFADDKRSSYSRNSRGLAIRV